MTFPYSCVTMPGMRCAVAVCKNSYFKTRGLKGDSAVSYFRIPKDKSLRKIWIDKCKRKDDWNPDTSCVCSDHFRNEDFERNMKAELMGSKQNKFLIKGAIPSLKLLPRDKNEVKSSIARSERLKRRETKLLVSSILSSSDEIVESISVQSTNPTVNYENQYNELQVKHISLQNEYEDFKSKLSSVTIKEEHGTDDFEQMCDASTIVIKSEQTNTVAVKQEYRYECSGSDREEREVKSERDLVSIVVETQTESNAVAVKQDYKYEWSGSEREMKSERDPLSFVVETQTEVMAGTSGVLSSSGNTSLALPSLQHECISETDEDISQHTDVDLCSYSCDFCNKKFNKLFQLQNHTVIHKDEHDAKVGTEYQKPDLQAQKNIRSKQIQYRHICSICDKSFTETRSLKYHMTTHTGEKPFSCEICNKSFRRHDGLKTHIRTHTGEKPFCCKICNKSFTDRRSLKRHMTAHTGEKPYCCEICNKSFSRHERLRSHMRTHTGERPFCCKICNKSFMDRRYLNIHMRIHTRKPFCCKICNKTFIQQECFKKHMRSHTGERPFRCEICNKSFAYGGPFKIHMRTHTGERPFRCEICNKSFTEGRTLKAHMRTHTGERPFCCEICSKSYTERGSLKAHMRYHSGERPFRCEICNNSFTGPKSLKRHLKSHTD